MYFSHGQNIHDCNTNVTEQASTSKESDDEIVDKRKED